MEPSYISLAYLIDFRMIKLYRLPGKVWKRSNFTSISINLWYVCKTCFEFVIPKTYLLFFDIVAIATNSKSLLKQSSTILPSSAVILLVVWSANDDCSASSKVNLLNDNTYRCDSATIIISSFRQIEQGAH